MRITAFLIFVLVALMGLVGCAGDNAPFRGETPFTGAYSGNWFLPPAVVGGDGGPMTLTIANNALAAGTFTNTATGEGGTISGAVNPDGGYNFAFTVDGTGERILISGQLAKMSDGGIAGDGTYTRPGQAPRGFSFTLPNGDGGGGEE